MQSDVEKVITSIEYIEKHLSEKLDLEIVAGAPQTSAAPQDSLRLPRYRA